MMIDYKKHKEEVTSLHDEIFLLTKENERIRILLKTLWDTFTFIDANKSGNPMWVEAAKAVNNVGHIIQQTINK